MSEYPATVQLSTLNGTTGFVINGIDVDDSSGQSIAGAGDLNDDGFADLIIGAPDADPNGNSQAGEAYLVFGKATWGAAVDLAALGATGSGSTASIRGTTRASRSPARATSTTTASTT